MNVIIQSPEPTINGAVLVRGTKVILTDGSEIKGITGITVRYDLGDVVRATLDIFVDPRNIQANAILSLDTVKEAAKVYGYELKPMMLDATSLEDDSIKHISLGKPYEDIWL